MERIEGARYETSWKRRGYSEVKNNLKTKMYCSVTCKKGKVSVRVRRKSSREDIGKEAEEEREVSVL